MISKKQLLSSSALLICMATSQATYAASCKTKLRFTNEFNSVVLVQSLAVHTAPRENFRNMRIPAGGVQETKRHRKMYKNTGLQFAQNGEKLFPIHIRYKLWEPQNNRWVQKGKTFTSRVCRHNKTWGFKLN